MHRTSTQASNTLKSHTNTQTLTNNHGEASYVFLLKLFYKKPTKQKHTDA